MVVAMLIMMTTATTPEMQNDSDDDDSKNDDGVTSQVSIQSDSLGVSRRRVHRIIVRLRML